MKIGVMGGTFDPIHLAHLEMGREAKRQKKLDQVWFMPSKIPPHKKGKRITEEQIRYHWVEAAVSGEEDFFASDFELRYPKTTYTAETLARLQAVYPEEKFSFILGGDSLLYFDKWYHPEMILNYAEIYCFSRDGISKEQMEKKASSLMEKFGGTIEVLSMKEMDISSSMIREKIRQGQPVSSYLPKELVDFFSELEKVYGK